MNIDLLNQPDSAIAKVRLEAGETIHTQAGSMVAMAGLMRTSTTLHTGKRQNQGQQSLGIWAGLQRKLAGESLFLSVFQATTPAEVLLAPQLPGDIWVYELGSKCLRVQSGAYLASTPNVDLTLGFEGFKSVFAGQGLFWLNVAGSGTVLLTSFGGIYEVTVSGEYIVDTSHIVAFEESLKFELTKSNSGWLGSLVGGEGLVCRFQGRGKVYCQTHSNRAFGRQFAQALGRR